MMSENFKIVIMVDNHAVEGLSVEHGFSLWIDTGMERLLFDTGKGEAFADNTRKLGIDLAQTDFLVLSHGHYDHTGGIPHVLQHAWKGSIACHPGVVHPRYKILNGTPTPVQMPIESMIAIDKLPQHRLRWVQKPAILTEKIGMTGPIPRETSYEDTGGPFFLDSAGKYTDPINDDLAIWIQTDEGLVVCVGCAHAGLVNTLKHIRSINHGSNIRAIIGGFHLL